MRALVGFLAVAASPALAVTCEDVDHLGASYTICEVDPAVEDLQLFLRDDDGDILGSFAAVEDQAGRPLVMAMNAGMYHDDRRPVGLYVEDKAQEMRLVTSEGPGNFGLLPNGVFCIGDTWASVLSTPAYVSTQPDCRDATQSGPMLVIDGKLHPRLIPNGTSRHYRNGVGSASDGRIFFAISNQPVNFHDFATLFRDEIGTPNALYFDGKVSRLYAADQGRSDFGWQMGPIVGVLAPVDATGN